MKDTKTMDHQISMGANKSRYILIVYMTSLEEELLYEITLLESLHMFEGFRHHGTAENVCEPLRAAGSKNAATVLIGNNRGIIVPQPVYAINQPAGS